MNTIQRFGIWLKRFRYRCGYGVHSPFAFNFISGVIFERGTYYAYNTLDVLYGKKAFWRVSHLRKRLHFYFRLANFIRPDFFVLDSRVSVAEEAYLSSGSRQSRRLPYMGLDTLDAIPEKKALIFVTACELQLPELLKNIKGKVHPSSVLLLRTESTEVRKRCSEIIRKSPDCGVSFDLYDYLLVFFDLSLYKQHYLINFFD